MKTENKELLDKVVKDRLEWALANDVGSEEEKLMFEEAMKAIDRQVELEKIESAKKEQKENRVVRIVEIVAVPVALETLGFIYRRIFMKDVCNFEKDYTFTTTPGRSISGLFKWTRKK